ncbi:MAG: beta-ketoacyl-[acyl-carrier-protein] synthase family protein [Phycisphaeraceae bacterium]|nr:MAG: beta-ketoacyl-[acyl-carrier-protein] synthase family protein [Phycisphaeraceae bacterium]
MSARRVVITGMGWVTPFGHDLETVWARLLAGESAIGPITKFDASTFATNFGGEVRGFDLARVMGGAAANHERAGEGVKFALAAASMAWRQAGLGDATGRLTADVNLSRMGVYMGSGEGPHDYDNFFAASLAAWREEGRAVDTVEWARLALDRMTAAREIEQEPNLSISHIARAFGCGGPAYNCMTACAASTQASGEAYEIIKRGDADLMFAGGEHSMLHILGMTGFIRLTAMSTRRDDYATASRPFSRTRDGFVMGEGAGVLVLEELDHALARGATPLAEVAGYGSTADAYRITDIQPEGKGAQKAMLAALRHAGIDPREPDGRGRAPVQYISAHGTGTPENDGIETAAVKGVFGPLADKACFCSLKSMTGHLIQAAGAVELIACVLAIRDGKIPPTINLDDPDPECDLDHVPNVARDLTDEGGVEVCLSNSFGFGGQNDTICVRRYRG